MDSARWEDYFPPISPYFYPLFVPTQKGPHLIALISAAHGVRDYMYPDVSTPGYYMYFLVGTMYRQYLHDVPEYNVHVSI